MCWIEWMKEELANCGMFESQINAVCDRVINDKTNHDMKARWYDEVSGYPPILKNLIWLSVKRHALSYIDEVIPQAWFREVFVD